MRNHVLLAPQPPVAVGQRLDHEIPLGQQSPVAQRLDHPVPLEQQHLYPLPVGQRLDHRMPLGQHRLDQLSVAVGQHLDL
jgi:hypothetical protein